MEEEKKVVVEMLKSKFCKKWMKMKMLRLSKSTEASDDMRKFANEVFKTEIHDEIIHQKVWRCYTSCIITAEKDSESLAFGYGNRSAILIHLSKYEECIKDIDRALAISEDDVFCAKLMLRKAKCLHALKSKDAQSTLRGAKCLIDKINNKIVKDQLKESLAKTKVLLQKPIKSNATEENKNSGSLNTLMEKHEINDFSSVNIQSNEKYGRHLVAAKDFKPGDVIFIEKPYIQCINLYNMHGYCSHCFNVCWTNTPCDHCSWAMFCSEECKKEAWKEYHDVECSVWACAKQPGDCTPQQLALRAMILALKEYGSLEIVKAEMEAIDNCTDIDKGFMHNGRIQPCGFKAMCSLSRDVSEESLAKIHKEPLIKMLKSIGLNTELFGDNFDESNAKNYKGNKDAVLFGTLFLRLSKVGQINGRQIWNHRYYPCSNNPHVVTCPLDKQCCTAGSYIAPVTSLLNHCCVPNARVCYGSNNSIIVYATRSIKKGEQIFDCYTFQVNEEATDKRQKIHSYMYNFVCDCIACQENLPFGHLALDLTKYHLKKASASDMALSMKYDDIIRSSVPNVRTNYDEKVIRHIAKGIEKALKTGDLLSMLLPLCFVCKGPMSRFMAFPWIFPKYVIICNFISYLCQYLTLKIALFEFFLVYL